MPIRIYRHVPEPGIVRYGAGDTGASTRWNCVVPKGRNGAPRYVRVGEGGAVATSETGASGSWTSQTSGTVNMLNFVIYDSYTSKYWAVGASGTMLSSSDGVTWSAVSLPVDVATDNLTGIATDGAGTFVVSNSSGGNRQLYSTNSGVSWSVTNAGIGWGGFSVQYIEGAFYVGRNSDGTNAIFTYSSNVGSGTWVSVSIPAGNSIVYGIESDGVNRIIVGSNGLAATNPTGSSPIIAGNWTVRSTGTSASLRTMVANGKIYLFGSGGISLESSDNGVTWQAGPPVGAASFLRYGVADASDPTRAIVVGDAGVTLFGQYGLRVKGYATAEDRPSNPIAQSPKFAFVDQPVTGLTVDLL